MTKKRSKIQIIIEILENLRREEEVNPTRLSLLINLSYDRTARILEELSSKGLITFQEKSDKPSSRVVKLTPEGHKLYFELARIKELLSDYGFV